MKETFSYYQVQGRFWNGPCMTAHNRVWKPWVSEIMTEEEARKTMANGIIAGLDKESERKSGYSSLRIARVTTTVEVLD